MTKPSPPLHLRLHELALSKGPAADVRGRAATAGPTASLAAAGLAGVLLVAVVAARSAQGQCVWPYNPLHCPDYHDPPACAASQCPPGSGGPSGSTAVPGGPAPTGGGCQGCSAAAGASTVMPAWWVSEPYINLRLEEEPLGYQPGRGPRVAFHLSYQQRGALPYDPYLYGVGPNWSCSFLVFVGTNSGNVFSLRSGGGGLLDYTNGVPQARDGSILTPDSYGLHIEYADGSVDGFYNFRGESNYGGSGMWLRNYSMDPSGNLVTFNYVYDPSPANCKQLSSVVDADGRTTQLYYERTNDFPNLITKVVDPFNRTNLLEYDANGYLTNIVDVAGNTNSLTYDAANPGWITNLYVSPYGNTGFRYGGVDCHSDNFIDGSGQVDRFVEVTLPTLGQHLYLYRQDCTNLIPMTYTPMPTTGTLPNTLDNWNQCNRNSFH